MGLLGWLTNLGMGGGRAATLSVWTATGTKRSLRTASAGSGTTVTMKQGRNERRAFQILARADGEVANFDIATAALTHSNGTSTIAATNLRVYRAHQVEVTQSTYNPAELLSLGEPGWYPDALIPTVYPTTTDAHDAGDPITAGATYQALPYTLPANQTHTFVVDIFVPKGTVAGDYTGTVTVSANGQDDVEVAITLTVKDFSLPDTPALRTMFGSPASRIIDNSDWSFDDDDEWDNVAEVCNTIFAEFGLSALTRDIDDRYLYPTGSGESWDYIEAEVTSLRTHIDAYHPSVYVTGLGTTMEGHIGTYDADQWAAYLAAMEAGAVAVNRSDVLFQVYLADEPWTEAAYTAVNLWGPAVYNSDLDSLVATPVEPAHGEVSMIGAVNTWAVGIKDHDVAEAAAQAERIALGEKIWWYTAIVDTTDRPWWQLDWPILHYRVLPWMMWQQGVTGLLYWGGSVAVWDVYEASEDPWTQPITLTIGAYVYNYEGVLVLPCTEAEVGYNGIVPTLRLMAVRDSIQDYGYLAALSSLGLWREVDAEVNALITAVGDGNWEWDTEADNYEAARWRLGAMLASRSARVEPVRHIGESPSVSTGRSSSVTVGVGRSSSVTVGLGR